MISYGHNEFKMATMSLNVIDKLTHNIYMADEKWKIKSIEITLLQIHEHKIVFADLVIPWQSHHTILSCNILKLLN